MKYYLFALLLLLIGCASNGDEPTTEDIGARLQSEYAGISVSVFVTRNGAIESHISDPASGMTVYAWQSGQENDNDFCRLSIRAGTDSQIIKEITIVGSGQDSVDTAWFFHHKYIQGCKVVK